jgi:trehalose-phosphatase
LRVLAAQPNTLVYILSGRARTHLDKWFEGTGVGLSAEHGCFLKHPPLVPHRTSTAAAAAGGNTESGWIRLVNQFDDSWRDIIRPLFQHYTERTPGSFIEEKEINLTWHYRNTDPEFGSWYDAYLFFLL